jgi:hypothetical protein
MPTYRFLYDARGKSLIAVPPPVAPAPQAPVVAAPQPTVVTSAIESVVKETRAAMPESDPIQTVIDLKEWLEDHPDFGLEMDLLEEREVLKTPPHWRYVSNEIEVRRSNPSGDPNWEEQRRAAEVYVAMLRERQAAVEDAVELAAFASVASLKSEPDRRMHDALRALPKAGKVDQKIFTEIPTPNVIQPSLTLEHVDKWADALLERYEQIVKSMLTPVWKSVEIDSWQTWENRFRAYRKRGRRRPFEVDQNDLWLRTRGTGPAALFRNELAQMSLREWTDALWASMVRTLPPPSVLSIPDWVRGQIETELLGGRKTLIMIVGDSATSPSSQWLPSKLNGCLWIAKDRWKEYYPSYWHNIAKDATHWIFVVELSGDPKSLAMAASQHPRLSISTPTNSNGVVTMAYMARDKLPPEVTPVVPYVDNPKNVDDLVSRIESLIGRSQSAS